jgi:glycerol-3-phosphate acyltransferase PlsX
MIAVDAMGGDHAPGEVVKGALEYRRAGGRARIILVGREAEIAPFLGDAHGFEISNAPDVVGMHEHPAAALRRRAGTSIGLATQLVRERRADAVVSAGNTGAQMASAVLILGRIANIDRPALAGLIPTESGRLLCLLDIGATVDTDARNLLQFAVMGSLYMERVQRVTRPTVGLLNVGEESGKGSRVLQEAQTLLQTSGLNFHGNVEGRDIVSGTVDVIVCDGFVGNAVIKALEGLLDMLVVSLRRDVFGGPAGKLAAVLAFAGIRKLRHRMDYDMIGGVPLLGVEGVSVVTHGRARARMIRYAIEAAERTVRSALVDAIRDGLEAEAARA